MYIQPSGILLLLLLHKLHFLLSLGIAASSSFTPTSLLLATAIRGIGIASPGRRPRFLLLLRTVLGRTLLFASTALLRRDLLRIVRNLAQRLRVIRTLGDGQLLLDILLVSRLLVPRRTLLLPGLGPRRGLALPLVLIVALLLPLATHPAFLVRLLLVPVAVGVKRRVDRPVVHGPSGLAESTHLLRVDVPRPAHGVGVLVHPSRAEGASEHEDAQEQQDEAGDAGDGSHGPRLQAAGVFLGDVDDVPHLLLEFDLGHLEGLDFLEVGLEVVGGEETGGARRAEDVVPVRDILVPAASRGALGADDGGEILLPQSLVLHLVILIAAIAVVFPQPPANGGRVLVDGILHDIVEVDMGRGRVMSHDVHGDGELLTGGATVGGTARGGSVPRRPSAGQYDLLGSDRVQ
mmetsp:Transcript_33036/g.69327  ORF Transcript_33036/g.69327 Transcript_33036/m.69327 type:complete len:405 (+) Transcript_33036:635-1849(+)